MNTFSNVISKLINNGFRENEDFTFSLTVPYVKVARDDVVYCEMTKESSLPLTATNCINISNYETDETYSFLNTDEAYSILEETIVNLAVEEIS